VLPTAPDPLASAPDRGPTLAVVSCDGNPLGRILASNLVVYLRALREDLPLLALGLGRAVELQQSLPLAAVGGGGVASDTAVLTAPSLNAALRLGQFGVHHVDACAAECISKRVAHDPQGLSALLDRTRWGGLVVLAVRFEDPEQVMASLRAADAGLLCARSPAELERISRWLEPARAAADGGPQLRLAFVGVDRSARARIGGRDTLRVLREQVAQRGWATCRTAIVRSRRCEAALAKHGGGASILHRVPGSVLDRRMRRLAEEVDSWLGLRRVAAQVRTRSARRARTVRSGESPGAWHRLLLPEAEARRAGVRRVRARARAPGGERA